MAMPPTPSATATHQTFLGSEYKPNNAEPRRILVVGGAGYLGSCVCRELLEAKTPVTGQSYYVRCFDRMSYGDDGIKDLQGNRNFEHIVGDCRDVGAVMTALDDIDAVIMLAAIVGDPACAKAPEETLTVNYMSSKMLADACKYKGIARYIFASTCSVYGSMQNADDILVETSKLNPLSLYAVMKRETEIALTKMADASFAPVMFRMSTLYGMPQFGGRMRFDLVVQIMCANAHFKKLVQVWGGDQWRPLLHVNDAARAYVCGLQAPLDAVRGQAFNIGVTKENYQITQVAEIVQKHFGGDIDDNMGKDKRDYKVNADKAASVLGFEGKLTVEDAVKDMKKAFDEGRFLNYQDPKFHNVKEELVFFSAERRATHHLAVGDDMGL